MVLGVERHAVISLALPDRIAPNHLVGRWIDYCKYILVLQIHVQVPRNWVVLRHSRFAVKVQRADDFILLHVHYGFRFSSLIRDVQFVKRSGIGASIRSRNRLIRPVPRL